MEQTEETVVAPWITARAEQVGNHWHVRIWEGEKEEDRALTGTLVMSTAGWTAMLLMLRAAVRRDPKKTLNYDQLSRVAKRGGFVKWRKSGIVEKLQLCKIPPRTNKGVVFAQDLRGEFPAHQINPQHFSHRFQCFEVTHLSGGELHDLGFVLEGSGAVQGAVPEDAGREVEGARQDVCSPRGDADPGPSDSAEAR